MDFLNILSTHLETIGIISVGGILIWQRYYSGSTTLRKEITEEYKERNQQLEDKLKNCLDEIHKTNLVVAELRGTIQEKDKHIESLTQILQGRNPEMIELLKEIKSGNAAVQEFMQTIYKELNYQTKMLENPKAKKTLKVK